MSDNEKPRPSYNLPPSIAAAGKPGLDPLGDRNFVPPPPAYRPEALMQHCAAASLAGGIIAASGKAYDTEAALAVFRDVLARMYPAKK